MSDRANKEKRDEEAKETNTRTESTSMEETKGQDTGLRTSESYGRTDRRRRERDPRSSREKRENATQMRYDLGQSSEYPVRTGVADCQHYLNGHCFFGRSCRFNHPPRNQMGHDAVQQSAYQVRPQLPESSQMRHEMMQPSPNPGARDCRQYLQKGKCSYGAKCRFNHPPAPVLPDRVSLGAIDCKQYLQTGQCRFGLKCRYNHPSAAVLPQWVSRQICKFFQKGNCKNGSGCKFTHSMSGDGSEHQATAWGKKRRGENSSSRPWKRVRQQAHGPSVPSGEGGIQTEQRLEIPENRNVNAQENLQEQADMERQNREAEEKAQEERRQQIENARREARLRLERMRPRALTSSVDQLREALPDIGIDRKEGDGF